MRVLSSIEVSAVSGAGINVSPVLNINLNFFFALFSIFKKKSAVVVVPPVDSTPPDIG